MNDPLRAVMLEEILKRSARGDHVGILVRIRIFMLALIATTAVAHPFVAPASPSVRSHDVSLEQYRSHLKAISMLVDACQTRRGIKACDPAQVGPDDRVPVAVDSRTEQRLVRYGWLRVLLSKAEDPDPPVVPLTNTAKGAKTPKEEPSTVSELLNAAKARLQSDLYRSTAAETSPPSHAEERVAMQHVLAGAAFSNLNRQSVRDSAFEKLGNWLNHLFERVANLKARSAWVGRALVWGFILLVCLALVYSLLRLERRWRIQLTAQVDQPSTGAPSARDWQLWLEDARRAAANGMWREAIHFVYWAAISRLESRRLWPADRARTPREYLALVASEDPRQPRLSQLTHTFEQFWYGGRTANQSDYISAEDLASSLISGDPRTRADTSVASEGGAG